jgi:hypothetical protein
VVGQEEILMQVPLADAAKCLDFSLAQISSCQWSWGWCFWGSKMKPRSYVQVTENAFEYNFPNMPCLPLDMCVKDNIDKMYFDKLGSKVAYKADCGTPYHTCCCIALCGEVMVLAPHPAMANCLCLNALPCLFKMYPGVPDAAALVNFLETARGDFRTRKGGASPALLGPVLASSDDVAAQRAAAWRRRSRSRSPPSKRMHMSSARVLCVLAFFIPLRVNATLLETKAVKRGAVKEPAFRSYSCCCSCCGQAASSAPSTSRRTVFPSTERCCSPPMGAPHSGHAARSMGPPHSPTV